VETAKLVVELVVELLGAAVVLAALPGVVPPEQAFEKNIDDKTAIKLPNCNNTFRLAQFCARQEKR